MSHVSLKSLVRALTIIIVILAVGVRRADATQATSTVVYTPYTYPHPFTISDASPVPGNSGTITTSDVDSISLTLNWTAATDDFSAQGTLQYEVRLSIADNIDTVANAEANGTVILPYTADLSALNVSGLDPSATYFFTVIVKDGAGNKTAYVMTYETTSPLTTFYTISANGGVSLVTPEKSDAQLTVSHAWLEPNTDEISTGGLTGVAIIGLRQNGVLVAETGVPSSAPMVDGRMYAENRDEVKTSIALSNRNADDAVISFYFTDVSGVDFGSGSMTLKANHEIAAFLSEEPFNGPPWFQGTFTFHSSIPIGAIGLRGLANERGEFLMTTLPIAALAPGEPRAIVPHFADGGGWTTQLILTNASDATESGTVRFYGPGTANQNAPLLDIKVNGVSGSNFTYSIPPHGMARLATAGTNAAVQVGSVQITSTRDPTTLSDNAPVAAAILSFRNAGVTVSEVAVASQPAGSTFRVYTEASGRAGQPGSIQSGFAVASPSASPVTVSVELAWMDGSSVDVGPAVMTLPPGGQVTTFIHELFEALPANFRGIAQLTASSSVAVTALRGRYNERGDFLISTTPPLNETMEPSVEVVFPFIVSGLGYSTQITLFGQAGSGTLHLYSQDGTVRPGLALK